MTDPALNDSFTKTNDESHQIINTSESDKNSLQQKLLKKPKNKYHKRKLSSPQQKFQKLQEEQDTTLPMNPETAISSAFPLNIKTLDNQVRQFNLLDYKDKTIGDIMQSIFPDENSCQTKTIKFIYNGKLLKPEQFVADIKFVEDSFIHCVINNKSIEEENNDQINLPIEPPAQNDEQLNEQIQQVVNEFDQHNVVEYENRNSLFGAESNSDGNAADFVCGFLASYFFYLFGFLLIFCCRFSQKAKKGAMIGLIFRTIYNLFLLGVNNNQSS